MKRKSFLLILSLLMAFSLVLAACDTSEPEASPTVKEEAVTKEPAATQAEAEEVTLPKSISVLYLSTISPLCGRMATS